MTLMSLADSKLLKHWQIFKNQTYFHFFDYFHFFGFYRNTTFITEIFEKYNFIHFMKKHKAGKSGKRGCPPAGRYEVTGTTRRELASAFR